MENFPKKEIATSEIKAQFFGHKHDTDIDIYTEGSKTGNERVGAGLAILLEEDKPQNMFTTKGIKLNNKATILSAELEAIKTGLASFFGLRDKTLAIYSDSKGPLQSIMQFDPKHPIVKEIQGQLSRLYAYNTKVTLCWIPSHCGIAGNELADKQANTASKKHLTPAIEAGLPVVAKDLNSHIAEQGKIWLQNKWDRDSFNEYDIENKLHFIDGKIGERKLHTFATRLDEIKYNRIRLGHTRLTNSYLAGADEPPLCVICMPQLESHQSSFPLSLLFTTLFVWQ
jgi:ribonuclease HI